MNPAAKDLADLILSSTTLTEVLVAAENLFIGREPAEPDLCVTLFDTPGSPPDLTLAGQDDPGYYFPSVQVRVRSRTYPAGWALVNSIKDYLHGLHGISQGGSTYDKIACAQEPFFLQWDEDSRAIFVVTFDTARKNA